MCKNVYVRIVPPFFGGVEQLVGSADCKSALFGACRFESCHRHFIKLKSLRHGSFIKLGYFAVIGRGMNEKITQMVCFVLTTGNPKMGSFKHIPHIPL